MIMNCPQCNQELNFPEEVAEFCGLEILRLGFEAFPAARGDNGVTMVHSGLTGTLM